MSVRAYELYNYYRDWSLVCFLTGDKNEAYNLACDFDPHWRGSCDLRPVENNKMTPEELIAAFAEVVERNPLPEPDKKAIAEVLFARKGELNDIIGKLSLHELRELTRLPHFTKLSPTVTRTIIEELLDRLEEKEGT